MRPLSSVSRYLCQIVHFLNYRSLRKTRQVHVKCMCASPNPKEDAVKKGVFVHSSLSTPESSVARLYLSPLGTDKILETPAFPHGLETAAALSIADGPHSDSGQTGKLK